MEGLQTEPHRRARGGIGKVIATGLADAERAYLPGTHAGGIPGRVSLVAILVLAFLGAVGLAVAIALGVAAVGSLLRRDSRRAGVQALLAALLVGTPFLAVQIAERSNGWVDADSNGMLDPMSNGSYDWVDVNAGKTAVVWGLLTVPLLAVWVVTSRDGGST